MKRLAVGENFLQPFNLRQSDGVTALNLAACYSITCAVIMNETVIATYTYGTHPELFEGDYPYQLVLEGKTTLATKPGLLKVQLTIVVNNPSYPVEGKQTDKKYLYELFKVYQ